MKEGLKPGRASGKVIRIRFFCALFLLLLDGTAMLVFHRFPSFFFPAYRTFSSRWIALLAAITSFSKGTLWDILALLLFLWFLWSICSVIRKRFSFLSWLSVVILIVSSLVSSAVLGWMLNHYAPPLSELLGYETHPAGIQELYDAAAWYFEKAAEYAVQMERDEAGHLLPVSREKFDQLAVTAGAAYQGISREYPVFQGSSVRVKRFSLIGEYLMYNGIIGMFMPLSGEAAVPGNAPSVPMPFNMCHEAAHRLGIASEQEANFCAFLACIENEDERFVYSGCYMAFSYCFSSLYRADSEKALALIEKHRDDEGVRLVFLDRSDTAAVYQKYESKLQDVSDKINATYLKTFSQEDGIRSYGMVSDYLIAWYLKDRR